MVFIGGVVVPMGFDSELLLENIQCKSKKNWEIVKELIERIH